MAIHVELAVDVELERAFAGAGPAPSAEEVSYWVRAAAQAADVAHGEVCVRVVGETEGRALNEQWRGKDYATNVLSFPAGDFPPELGDELGDERPLGDLVICAPVVAREAREQRKPAEHHWAHLLVHGTLHLFGYDHEDSDDARVMEDLETRLLALRNIPDPYRPRDESIVDSAAAGF